MSQRSSITIRLDEELHTQIKIEVAKRKTTITDYLIGLVKKDLSEKKQK
jgi:predicted DNA binding CopG/RHH family protein